MEKYSPIKKNVLYQVAVQTLLLLIPLITTPYVTRIFGPELLGTHSFVYVIANYFVIFSMLGLLNYGSREVSKVRNDKELLKKTFLEIYKAHIFVTFIVCIIYGLFLLVNLNSRNILLYLVSIIYLISSFFDINWFFRGIEQFKSLAIRNIILKILTMITIFVFVSNSSHLVLYSFLLSISTLFSNIVVWPILFKYIDFNDFKKIRFIRHLKPMILLFIPVISVLLYQTIGRLLLGKLSSIEELGYFDQAEKIMNLGSIIYIIGVVMLPRISYLFNIKEDEKALNLTKFSIIFSGFFGCGLAFGLIALGDSFSLIYYGENFMKSGSILITLAPSIIFMSFENVLRTHFVIPLKLEKQYITIVILGVILNILLNIILVPKYNSIGSAISILLTQIFITVIQFLFLSGKTNVFILLYEYFYFILFGLLMYFFIGSLRFPFVTNLGELLLKSFLGGIFYSTISILYFYLRFKFDKKTIQKIIESIR